MPPHRDHSQLKWLQVAPPRSLSSLTLDMPDPLSESSSTVCKVGGGLVLTC